MHVMQAMMEAARRREIAGGGSWIEIGSREGMLPEYIIEGEADYFQQSDILLW
jgi:hypothetical protein